MTTTEQTEATKKPWYKIWWVWVIVAVVIVAYGASNAAKGDEVVPEATPTASVATEAPAVVEEPVEEEAPAATSEEVESALLAALGTDNFQTLPTDMWGFYIADVEAVNSSLVRITLQVGQEDPVAEDSSRAMFSLIGEQFPDLKFVEVVDGAGMHIEQTNRSDVPLLN